MPVAAAIARLQAHRTLALVVGVVVELVFVTLIGLDHTIRDTRGIGGESAVLLAVFGALAAGPVVGSAMALAGWAVFFPLIADSAAKSFAALPLWLLTTYAVGRVSQRLAESERERMRADFEVVTAHELRTPVAVIHGMAQSLRRQDFGAEERDKVLELIEEESRTLLERGPFEADEPER
jgi:signal transduction histidine kinase